MTLELDPQVEIYVVSTVDGSGWLDISHPDLNYVLSDGVNAIEIEHGNRGMAEGIPEPSECRMTWDVTDGRLWPGNVTSDLWPSVKVNTPLRVALPLIEHTFPGTVVDDWAPVGDYAVVNTGGGGSVLDSDFQQTPGVGTHSVPIAVAYRQTVLDGFDMEDCEQSIEFQLPFSNTTGGAVEPANLIFRYVDTVDHFLLRVVVNADETITMKWLYIQIGIGEFDATDAYTAPITHSGQWLKVSANIEGNRFQAKIWDPDDPEPLAWVVNEAVDTTDRFHNPGSIGVRSGVASGNTNTKPIVISYRNWTVRSLRFHGELSKFPMQADTTGNILTVPIVAAGVTRRLNQGTPPTLSALRRAIPQQPGVQQYWPMEDPSGVFGSAVAGAPPMAILHGTPGYAEYSDLPSSRPLPTGNQADWRGDVPDYTDTGELQVSFVLYCPAVQVDRSILARWYINHPTAKLWQLIYRSAGSGDLQLQAWNSESAFVYESAVIGIGVNATTRFVSVTMTNNGSNVDWEIRALDMMTGGTGSFGSGTATGLQLATCKSVWMNLQLLDTPAFGHVVVQSEITDFFELSQESRAWDGDETDGVRINRLLDENGYECTRSRGLTAAGELMMGAQEPGTLPALLEECIVLGTGGTWFDARGHAGIMYYARTAQYNLEPWVSLSYAGEQLQPEWQPVIGDRVIRNKVTVDRRDGSEATYALESGPLSILPIEDGGVGEYASGDVTVNAEDDTQLLQMAAFRVALGTTDEPVYPAAVVECAADGVVADPVIHRRLLDLRPSRVFEVTDAVAVWQFGAARLRCVGYTETLSQFLHRFALIGEPVGPYLVWELEHDLYGQLDSASSTLTSDITSSATSFQVSTSDAGDLWTTAVGSFPLDVEIGGEQITLASISGASSPQTFTVDTGGRGKNGAVKGHRAGDAVHIFVDPRYAL